MNMREIQKMQQKLVKMQEELEASLFTGTAGGGAVTITMSGKFEITAVKIDPEAFNAEDIAELEVMVLAAARDAFSKASDAQQKLASSVTGGMKIPGMF
jgi:nucleoid-associated protein EbfC